MSRSNLYFSISLCNLVMLNFVVRDSSRRDVSCAKLRVMFNGSGISAS